MASSRSPVDLADWDMYFQNVFPLLWKEDVIIVAGAGQLNPAQVTEGFSLDMSYHTPARLVNLDNDDFPLILVGGIDPNTGQIPPNHLQETNGKPAIAVYGSYTANCVLPDLNTPQIGVRGTSVASPQVAGVIASWLQIPEVASRLKCGDS